MTTKEMLIDLVEHLDEREAAEVFDILSARYGTQTEERRLPTFVGMGHSGRSDLGRRSKEVLRAELGGHAR